MPKQTSPIVADVNTMCWVDRSTIKSAEDMDMAEPTMSHHQRQTALGFFLPVFWPDGKSGDDAIRQQAAEQHNKQGGSGPRKYEDGSALA
ncbi:uncharacterized protein PpBr36_10141 [Pyricularia pennisetigena]|uniref:uncharacterized protein n=1 Tax=Pyricularia pennisetigena TaxID=1578925 RepID=UPI00114F1BC9|nr:uncharacterized protein PpBr36_10141 [Pyricularia pennisetigena]TLS21424.1 hypothetical protein PpBr36_10141 [Pyricularia pennisetigena]